MILDATIRATPERRTTLLDSLNRQRASYELLELIRSKRPPPKLPRYRTSDLAMAEILSVLLEEYIGKAMFTRGIPFKYWERERHEWPLRYADVKDIYRQLDVFIEAFDVYPNKYISIVKDAYKYPELFNFVLHAKVDTYDAVLLSTALKEKCRYFITDDKRLREKVPKYKNLKLVSAEDYRSRFLAAKNAT